MGIKYFSKDIWAFKESVLISELDKKYGLMPNHLLFTELVIIYRDPFWVYTKYCVPLLSLYWAKTRCWVSYGDIVLVFINSSLQKSLILLLRAKKFSHKTSTSFLSLFKIITVLCCPCKFDRWLIINLRYCGSDRNLIGYLWTKYESVECRSMLRCHFDISFRRLNPLFWNIWIHTVCFSLVDVYISRQKHNSASHELIKLYQ